MKFVNFLAPGPVLAGILIGALLGSALGYFGQCTSGACPLTSTWWRGALYGAFLGFLFTFSGTRDARSSASPGPLSEKVENVPDNRSIR